MSFMQYGKIILSAALLAFVFTACAGRHAEQQEDAVLVEIILPSLDGKWAIKDVEQAGEKIDIKSVKQELFLEFDSTNQQVAGMIGCNNLMAKFVYDGSNVIFAHPALTRMACSKSASMVEQAISKGLLDVFDVEMMDNMLIMNNDSLKLSLERL